MRIAITILAVLVVAVVGGGFALSRLIAAEELHAQIVEESVALTGSPLLIEGRIDLSFLPRPTVSFSDARFDAAEAGGATLEVDRVDLNVDTLALLTGRVEVEAVRLVRPRLTLRATDGPPLGLIETTLAQTLLPARAGLRELSVVDGSAVVPGGASLLETVDLEVSARGDRGPFSVAGSFAHAGETFELDARLGRLTADPDTTLQATLTSVAGSPLALQLSFSGIVSLAAPGDVRGQIRITGNDLGRTGRALVPSRWRERLAAAPPLAIPFAVEGVIESEAGRGRLGELVVVLAGAEGEGHLAFDRAAARIDLELDLPLLHLGDGPLAPAAFASLVPITAGLAGTIDLSFGRLVRGSSSVREARLALDLDPAAGIAVRQLRAVLPGDTDLVFEGRLRAQPERALEGRLTMVTDRLGDTLVWLGVDPESETVPRFRTMSLAADLMWTAEAIGLTGIDGRLDASRVEGAFQVRPGARPRIQADLAVDRLTLGPQQFDLSSDRTFVGLVDGIRRFDLDLALEIGRLVHDGGRFADLSLRGSAEDGRLTLERFAAGTLADTELEAAGVIDANDERFEIRSEIRSARPGPLLRRLGFAPAISLSRIGALDADVTAEGWREAIRIETEITLGKLVLTSRGRLGLDRTRPFEADLDVDLVHPHYDRLLASLGLAHEPDTTGPVAGAGKIRADGSGRVELIGHLALGESRLTGQIARLRRTPRPAYEARISLAEPRLETLLPLAALIGYRLDRNFAGRPFLGAWPRQPLDLGGLGSFDGRLTLSGKGGAAQDGLDASVVSEDGRLVVERAMLRLPEGELEVAGELDLEGRVPDLSLSVAGRDLEIGTFLDALDLPAAISGRLDLFGRIGGAGTAPYDLVRSLRGELTFSVEDGEAMLPVPGETGSAARTPLALLEGRADVWRGVAELARLELETADGLWRGEGRFDLLLWIIELTLNGEDGRRIRVVGRPDDPQVRVEALGAAAPAE